MPARPRCPRPLPARGRADLRYDVDVDASGYSPGFLRALAPGAEAELVLRVGHDVRGRVVQLLPEGERAIWNARVELTRPNPRGLWFRTSVSTEQDGAFAFPRFLPEEGGSAETGWRLLFHGAELALTGATDDLRVQVRLESPTR